MASRQRHKGGTKEETASAAEWQPNKFLFFYHISKDETAKGGSQLSVLVPHFSFTYIRFPLLHCAHVVPTLQQFSLLSFGSSFCSLRVCSFPRYAWSLFSCGACLLLLRRDWRSNFLHVSQLACSETQMKITRESKAEWKSSKMRAWRWKDIKMKSTKEIKWDENCEMRIQLQVLINRKTCEYIWDWISHEGRIHKKVATTTKRKNDKRKKKQ